MNLILGLGLALACSSASPPLAPWTTDDVAGFSEARIAGKAVFYGGVTRSALRVSANACPAVSTVPSSIRLSIPGVVSSRGSG